MKEDLFVTILKTSLEAPSRNTVFVWGKVGEEFGEIAGASLGITDEPVPFEIADYIVTLADLFYIIKQDAYPDIDAVRQALCYEMTLNYAKTRVDPISPIHYDSDNIGRLVFGFLEVEGIEDNVNSRFREMAASYGNLCRCLNQPDRSSVTVEFSIVKCIFDALRLLYCHVYWGYDQISFEDFESMVEEKVNKWRGKVGLIN